MKARTEKAIVGFWKMNSKQEFKCYHYFYVPTPLKREIRKSDRKDWGKKSNATANVYQILHRGHNDDIFIVFNEDEKLSIGILNLDLVLDPEKSRNYEERYHRN